MAQTYYTQQPQVHILADTERGRLVRGLHQSLESSSKRKGACAKVLA